MERTSINSNQTVEFEEVRLCPHCLSIAEVKPVADEHFLFCTDGCGCLEGWTVQKKFLCPHCGGACDDQRCTCKGYVVNQLETRKVRFILEAIEETGEIWYDEMIDHVMRQTNEVLLPYLTRQKKLSRLTIF